jgi:AcrR family transcriptional regulator
MTSDPAMAHAVGRSSGRFHTTPPARYEENSAVGLAHDVGRTYHDGTRRIEILQTASSLIASSGLRVSIQEIADAAGIMPGSLYHHFESKDAIFSELVRRYHADLDVIGKAALARVDEPDSRAAADKIIQLGSAIAHCAVKHRAALQMSFYEAPSDSQELVELLQQRPTVVQQAMLQTLRAARLDGYIRSEIDLPALADRICQSMMHVGLDVIRHTASTNHVAAALCRIMLLGLASRPHSDEELDNSRAFAAAEHAINSWTDDSEFEANEKAGEVRAVARAVFGRRGYDGTTVRDIASAANLSPGSVYRLIGSKDRLFSSIMESFGRKAGGGFANVLCSEATPVEKLDALCWVNINALDRSPDEWKVQLAWMRQSPPDTPNPGLAFSTRLAQLKGLLSEGIRTKDLLVGTASLEVLSRCVMDALWMPESLVRGNGRRQALIDARDTVVRGIAHRSITSAQDADTHSTREIPARKGSGA